MGLEIKLKDKAPVDVDANSISTLDALKELGVKGMENIVAVKVDDRLCDLSCEINSSATIDPVRINSAEGIDIMRHSTSHVMAMAVKELFPGVKVTIGPSIENGFYYDFDYERPFKEDDLQAIEEKMNEIIRQDLPFAGVKNYQALRQ